MRKSVMILPMLNILGELDLCTEPEVELPEVAWFEEEEVLAVGVQVPDAPGEWTGRLWARRNCSNALRMGVGLPSMLPMRST